MFVVSQSHVLKFSPAGTLIGDLVVPDAGRSGGPSDLVVNCNGTIYVANTFADRIQTFTAAGRPSLAWRDANLFDGPIRLAIDPTNGRLWVADLTHAPLQEFTRQGVLVAKHSEYGVFPGQIIAPNGLAFDRRGSLYVVDYGNNRIQERAGAP